MKRSVGFEKTPGSRLLANVGRVVVVSIGCVVSSAYAVESAAPPLVATLRIVTQGSPSELEFGRPFLVDVVRTHPPDWSVDDWQDHVIVAGGVDLWSELQDETRRATSTSIEESRRYEVRIFATGEVRLSPGSMSGTSPTGESVLFSAVSLVVEVASSLTSSSSLSSPEEIELPSDVVDAPSQRSIVWWLLPSALVAAIVGVVVRRGRRSEAESPPSLPPEPSPSIVASTLAQIEALPIESEVTPFYSELAAIVRGYLASRFDDLPLPLTSEELVAVYRTERGREGGGDRIERLLEECDGVKFARVAPPIELRREAIDAAVVIVTLTSNEEPT